MHRHLIVILVGTAVLAMACPTRAALQEEDVLLIYNSQVSSSVAVRDHYLSVRPGVRQFDLNDATLSGHTLTYTDYVSKIRDPLRQHLTDEGIASDVAVLTLTKGIPYRIDDTDNPDVGASGGTASDEFNENSVSDATYASVDSELTLLWQPLEVGEAGGDMDSVSDNLVHNPYYGESQSITGFDRSGVTSMISFVPLPAGAPDASFYWVPSTTAGNMYLTARLDGHTVQDVTDAIDRAQNIVFNEKTDAIILDENDGRLTNGGDEFDDTAFTAIKVLDPSYGGNDYDEAAALLASTYDLVYFDQTSTLIEGKADSAGPTDVLKVAGPVAVIASFSTQHDQPGVDEEVMDNFVDTFAGQFVDGAIFNTLESFNGVQFGPGMSDRGQEQVADFLAAGGTLGIGSVWEPFAQSLADNEVLLDRFLNDGLTWVEAAWASIGWVSWQQLVIGDPLATAQVISEPAPIGDVNFDGVVDHLDINAFIDVLTNGTFGDPLVTQVADVDMNGEVNLLDINAFLGLLGGSAPEGSLEALLAAAPEPGSGLLLGLPAALLARRRRVAAGH